MAPVAVAGLLSVMGFFDLFGTTASGGLTDRSCHGRFDRKNGHRDNYLYSHHDAFMTSLTLTFSIELSASPTTPNRAGGGSRDSPPQGSA